MSGFSLRAARHGALGLAALAVSACVSTAGPVRSGSERPVTRASLSAALDAMVSSAEFRNAHWGILIVDPERGDTLYSRNAGKLFMPASNMKIVTGAVALATLGPEYRFRTDFATTGTIRDGVLLGDLVVIGRGDPSLSDRMRGDAMLPMREIADSLAALGITRIDGRITTAGDAFPDAIHGFGWAWDDFDAPYSAGVDELYFNEGFWRIVVHGGSSAGDTVVVRTHGDSVPAVRVRAVTVEAASVPLQDSATPRPRVRLARDDDGSLVVEGTILVGDSSTLTITQAEPRAAYLRALRTALVARGIAIGTDVAPAPPGGASPSADRAEAPTVASSGLEAVSRGTLAHPADSLLDTLFTVWSPPLSEILIALEKPSQNQIAEILFKTLGLEVTGSGTADSGRVVVERRLLEWGVDSMGFAIRDGSGLSRHNYLTPETVVRILDRMRADTAFRYFHDALPIAGVDGTIGSRMRGTPAEGNLRAKTGTLDKARALSGYVTTADGRLLIFSTFANNYTVPTRRVDAVTDALGAMLASMRLGR